MLRFVRMRMLPWLVWLGAASSAAWLWYDQRSGSALGYVEGVSYGITAIEPGRIATVTVQPGQRVQAGEVIATLDDIELEAELAVLGAERRRMEAELQTAAVETRLRVGDSSRELEETIDAAEIALEHARAERSVHTAELAATEVQVEETRELVDKRMLDRQALVELVIQQAALRKQIEVDDEIVRALDGKAAVTRARRRDLPHDESKRASASLLAALESLREQEAILRRRKESLVLRAPGAGEVTGLFLRPGEMANEGVVVATIAGPALTATDSRPLVFVCASESIAAEVEVGEAVELHPPEGGRAVLTGHVRRLAPEVGQLPMRCWRDSRIATWGRGIYVVPDEPVTLLPGQGFSVDLTGRPSPNAQPAALPPPPTPLPSVASEPASSSSVGPEPSVGSIVLPPELAARTRFEPSAIAWWPGRERYLVASDDTGLADVTEHLPWLFMMDASGRVDPEPLVIEGLEAMSDVEALALAPDGSLYVLASQSRSRKGKRSEARQVFARVELMSAGGARVTASVRLAELLDESGAEVLARLGLASTAELDIEGMTATTAGGLLLGLKGPLGPRNEAIAWRLPRPEELFATGDASAGGLAAWGTIPLTVTAEGAAAAGGIAELLELPDGTLLVAATAAGPLEPASQSGALYRVDGRAGVATPVLVRTFPGRKPEGLSRSADGAAITVVFDAGAGTPQWTEHPWPAH
jgi:multidrug resistance efflux pump